MRWFRRKVKHVHSWTTVGYGGAGWHLVQCSTCGAKEIAP